MDKFSRISIFVLFFAILMTVFLRMPYYGSGYLSNDEGVYATAALCKLRGYEFYQDAWSHKPPGFLYLYYWIYLCFGTGMKSVQVVFTVLLAGHLIALWFLVRPCLGQLGASIAVFLMAVLPNVGPMDHFNACHPTMAMLLPATTALLVAERSRFYSGISRHFILLASGLLWGIAFQMKQPALTLGLPLFYVCLQRDTTKESVNRLFNMKLLISISLVSIGFLFVQVVFILPIILSGTIQDFILSAVTYNSFYFQAISPRLAIKFFFTALWRLVQIAPVVWGFGILGFCGMVISLFRKESRRRLTKNEREFRWLAILWFISGVLGALAAKKAFLHYYIQIYPPLVILNSYLLIRIYEMLHRLRFWRILVVSSLAGVAIIQPVFTDSIYHNKPLRVFHRTILKGEAVRFNAQWMGEEVARYIRLNTPPEQKIFVWGFFPQLYAMSERLPASRFTFSQPLTGVDLMLPGQPMKREVWAFILNLQQTAMRELEQNPPFYIIDTAPAHFWGWEGATMTTIPKLDLLVKQNYRREKELWGIVLYRLNGK